MHSPYHCSNDIIIAWQPLAGTTATLTRDKPLNDHNTISMELTAGDPTRWVAASGGRNVGGSLQQWLCQETTGRELSAHGAAEG